MKADSMNCAALEVTLAEWGLECVMPRERERDDRLIMASCWGERV